MPGPGGDTTPTSSHPQGGLPTPSAQIAQAAREDVCSWLVAPSSGGLVLVLVLVSDSEKGGRRNFLRKSLTTGRLPFRTAGMPRSGGRLLGFVAARRQRRQAALMAAHAGPGNTPGLAEPTRAGKRPATGCLTVAPCKVFAAERGELSGRGACPQGAMGGRVGSRRRRPAQSFDASRPSAPDLRWNSHQSRPRTSEHSRRVGEPELPRDSLTGEPLAVRCVDAMMILRKSRHTRLPGRRACG